MSVESPILIKDARVTTILSVTPYCTIFALCSLVDGKGEYKREFEVAGGLSVGDIVSIEVENGKT